MGFLVTGVTRIVEKIYVITRIRPGRYKLFPQLVISFSLTSLDFARSRDQPQKELGPFSENPSTRLSAFTWLHGGGLYWCSKQILWELGSSYVKNFSCSHKFAWMMATWVNTLYTKNVKFERDLWTTNEQYRHAKSPSFTDVCMVGPNLCPHHTNASKILFRTLLTYHL